MLPALDGDAKVQYRDMKKIPSINTLCSIHGAPTLTEELGGGNTSFKVDGAQHLCQRRVHLQACFVEFPATKV